MDKIFYPTIDLFRYELKNSLGSTREDIQSNQDNFRAIFPAGVEFKDDNQEHEYLELTNPRQPDIPFKDTALAGHYYPVRLNDIYGLQIDCSFNNLTAPQPLETFASIKAAIEKQIQPDSTKNHLSHPSHSPFLGQTWLVSGWLPETPSDSPLDLAKEIYNILFPNASWQKNLYGEGSFLDSSIYELWTPQSSSHHVIVILFPNLDTAKQAADFYTDWMGLFSYRHKMNWAYQQSRLIKKSLVNHYQEVNKNIEDLKTSSQRQQRLSSLDTFLDKIQNVLNLYTVDILNLSFQKQIIEVNSENYEQRLEVIEKKLQDNHGIEFFYKFSDFAKNKYLEQINQDKESMKLGLQLLEDNINATRSRLDVEKAKQDKLFQNVIILLGSAWAGAAAAEQIVQPREWETEPISNYFVQVWDFPEKPAESVASFVWSLSGALILIIVILVLNRFIPLLDVTRRSKQSK